jgi:hypothetical protein
MTPVLVKPRPVVEMPFVDFEDSENVNDENGGQPEIFARRSTVPSPTPQDQTAAAKKGQQEDHASDYGDDEEEEEDQFQDEAAVDAGGPPPNKNGHILIHLKYSILTPSV